MSARRGMRGAMAAVALLACAVAGARADCPTRAYVLGSDYSTGTLSVVDLATGALTRDVAQVSGDPVGRWHEGRLYVVNRFGYDNVQVIDPALGYATIAQYSVGNGSNPQDIAFGTGHRAYVSRLGDPDLLVVGDTTGAALGRVGLAAFADADGIPEAARMIVVGDLLLVALGRMSSFVPSDTGLVAVIDLRADTLLDADPAAPGVQALRLHAGNPWTDFVRLPPAAPGGDTRLLLGCAGRWGVLDGGVEEIVVPPDAAAGGGLRAAGLLVTEAALGGDVTDVVADDPAHPYAVVSDLASNTSLVAWDPGSGSKTATLYAPGGFSISDAALDGCGRLAIANSSFTAPGLVLFASPADTALAAPLDLGLPPVSIVFGDSGAAVRPSQPVAVALGPLRPNPAAGEVRFAVALAVAAVVDIGLYDVAGRRVATLAGGPMGQGTTELSRALSTPDGRHLTSGVYVLRVRAGSSEARRRLVIVR